MAGRLLHRVLLQATFTLSSFVAMSRDVTASQPRHLLCPPELRVTASDHSMTSSIFDMTSEAEAVERAVAEGDVRAVRKFLSLHFASVREDPSVRSVRSHDPRTLNAGDATAEPVTSPREADENDSSVFEDDAREAGTLLTVPLTLKARSLPASLSSSPGCLASSPLLFRCERLSDVAASFKFRNLLHLAVEAANATLLQLMLDRGLDANEPGCASTDADDVIRCVVVRSSACNEGHQARRTCLEGCHTDCVRRDERWRLSSGPCHSSKSHCTCRLRLETAGRPLNGKACQQPNASFVAAKKTSVCCSADTRGRTCKRKHDCQSCLPVPLPAAVSPISAAGSLSCARLAPLPPLFLAAWLLRADCAELLLDRGAAVNAVDIHTGVTPLVCAAISRLEAVDCFQKTVEALISHGASLSRRQLGQHYGRIEQVFVQVLRQRVADLHQAAFGDVTTSTSAKRSSTLRRSKLLERATLWRLAAENRLQRRSEEECEEEPHDDSASRSTNLSKKSKRESTTSHLSVQDTRKRSRDVMDKRDASIERVRVAVKVDRACSSF